MEGGYSASNVDKWLRWQVEKWRWLQRLDITIVSPSVLSEMHLRHSILSELMLGGIALHVGHFMDWVRELFRQLSWKVWPHAYTAMGLILLKGAMQIGHLVPAWSSDSCSVWSMSSAWAGTWMRESLCPLLDTLRHNASLITTKTYFVISPLFFILWAML